MLSKEFAETFYSRDSSRQGVSPAGGRIREFYLLSCSVYLGKKVPSEILANAIKMSDMRRLLPSGSDRHAQGDAAEALILCSWITDKVTIEEAVRILGKETDPVEAFKGLLLQTMKEFSEKGLKERVSEPLREL